MRMKIEGGDTVQQTEFVQVFINTERSNLFRAPYHRWTKAELIYYVHIESLDYGARVLAQAVLAWNQGVSMMCVFELPLLHILRETNVMMRANQQACSVSFQPFAKCFDLLGGGFLFGN